jgi:hypothetical protein
VACVRDRRGTYRFWWVDQSEVNHLEDLGVDGRIIITLIFTKWNGEVWTGLLWLRIGRGKLVNAVINLRNPKKRGKILDYLRTS